MNKLEFSISFVKVVCPYMLILTCLFAKNVRQDILSMVVGASCALLTPASFSQKKEANKAITANEEDTSPSMIPEIMSEDTYTPDNSRWRG